MSNVRNFAAMFVTMLALATLTSAASAETHAHKGKKGNLKIAVATEVGGAVLQPGDYTVRRIDSAEGPMVEFALDTYNPYTGDTGLSPYDSEVVARVQATEQALSAAPKHTGLQLDSANAVALEIRGDAVQYAFGPAMDRADAMAACADAGKAAR